MAIEFKDLKNKVNEEWENALPQLSIFSSNKFYKVAGPIIVGLELIKLPRTEEYRPHFVAYPLWGNKIGKDIKACLSGPIILMEYYNGKGLQFSIPYDKHNIFFDEVLVSIKKQTPLLFDEDISLSTLFTIIDGYSKRSPLNASPNSYFQGALQEAKLGIALYKSDTDAQQIFLQMNKKDWDEKHFRICNVDVNKWLLGLQNRIENRNDFLKQISVNKLDKNIKKLKHCALI